MNSEIKDFYENKLKPFLKEVINPSYKDFVPVLDFKEEFSNEIEALTKLPFVIKDAEDFAYFVSSYCTLYFIREYKRGEYRLVDSFDENSGFLLLDPGIRYLFSLYEGIYFEENEAAVFYDRINLGLHERTYFEHLLCEYKKYVVDGNFNLFKIDWDCRKISLFMMMEFLKSKAVIKEVGAFARSIALCSCKDDKFFWTNIDNSLINSYLFSQINRNQIEWNKKFPWSDGDKYLKHQKDFPNAEFLFSFFESAEDCLECLEFANKKLNVYYESKKINENIFDAVKIYVTGKLENKNENPSKLFKKIVGFFETEKEKVFLGEEKNVFYNKIEAFPGICICLFNLIKYMSKDEFNYIFPDYSNISKVNLDAWNKACFSKKIKKLTWMESELYEYLYSREANFADPKNNNERIKKYLNICFYFAMFSLVVEYEAGVFIDNDEHDEEGNFKDLRPEILLDFYEALKNKSWSNEKNLMLKFNRLAKLLKFNKENPLTEKNFKNIQIKNLQRAIYLLSQFNQKKYEENLFDIMQLISDWQKDLLDCYPAVVQNKKESVVKGSIRKADENRSVLQKIDFGFSIYKSQAGLVRYGLGEDFLRKITVKMFNVTDKEFKMKTNEKYDRKFYCAEENYEKSNNNNLSNHYLYMSERNPRVHHTELSSVKSVMEPKYKALIPALKGVEKYLSELPSEWSDSFPKECGALDYYKELLKSYFKAINSSLNEEIFGTDPATLWYQASRAKLDYEKDLGPDMLASMKDFFNAMYNTDVECTYDYQVHTSLYLVYLLFSFGDMKKENESHFVTFNVPDETVKTFQEAIDWKKEKDKKDSERVFAFGNEPKEEGFEKSFFTNSYFAENLLFWQFRSILKLEGKREAYKTQEILVSEEDAKRLAEKYFVVPPNGANRDEPLYEFYFQPEFKELEYWGDIATRYLADFYNQKFEAIPTYIKKLPSVFEDFKLYHKIKDAGKNLLEEKKCVYEKKLASRAESFFEKYMRKYLDDLERKPLEWEDVAMKNFKSEYYSRALGYDHNSVHETSIEDLVGKSKKIKGEFRTTSFEYTDEQEKTLEELKFFAKDCQEKWMKLETMRGALANKRLLVSDKIYADENFKKEIEPINNERETLRKEKDETIYNNRNSAEKELEDRYESKIKAIREKYACKEDTVENLASRLSEEEAVKGETNREGEMIYSEHSERNYNEKNPEKVKRMYELNERWDSIDEKYLSIYDANLVSEIKENEKAKKDLENLIKEKISECLEKYPHRTEITIEEIYKVLMPSFMWEPHGDRLFYPGISKINGAEKGVLENCNFPETIYKIEENELGKEIVIKSCFDIVCIKLTIALSEDGRKLCMFAGKRDKESHPFYEIPICLDSRFNAYDDSSCGGGGFSNSFFQEVIQSIPKFFLTLREHQMEDVLETCM